MTKEELIQAFKPIAAVHALSDDPHGIYSIGQVAYMAMGVLRELDVLKSNGIDFDETFDEVCKRIDSAWIEQHKKL